SATRGASRRSARRRTPPAARSPASPPRTSSSSPWGAITSAPSGPGSASSPGATRRISSPSRRSTGSSERRQSASSSPRRSATPQSPTRLTLCADVAPGGIGSEWFRGLQPGDPVRFKGPLGGFVFTRADPRRPLFVAEEIGIVPIRAILTELYATGFGRRATLAYWARDPGWLAYDAAFRSLARRYPGFAYHPVVAGAAGAGRDGASRL